ncbi:MAG TPA: hypothetical protein VNX21_02660 [Candidatus Thermoplasmatota archaeon]|nr:hypothetical protein [Candidatus Thermoplasmatota archaeon]
MRARTLVLALLALASVAPVAAAHYDHDPCPFSTSQTRGVVHVDVWRFGCLGAAVSFPELVDCTTRFHTHFGGVHVFVLYGSGCQTGVILETLEASEAAAPLLP